MRSLCLPVLVLGAALGACGDRAPSPTEGLSASVVFSRADATNAHTHLSGRAEIPERDTRAQGQLKLQLSADGQTLAYKLIATNIDNIFQAHLHLAPNTANGPIVVWLYPAAPPAELIPGRHTGVLAEGEITAASLMGPLVGQPLSRLLEEIMAGNIYANVHTNDFVDPTNTGPGDFPGGEIRGQVETGG